MLTTDKDQHLIIMSLDALNAQDLQTIRILPHFSTFFEEGSYIKEVTSVYPSVTYTCHSSIITGTYPDKHGIYANELIHPEKVLDQEWYWYEKYIKVPTLFDYANNAGLITGNVLWPVMADAPITYNCPEIWSTTGESYFSLYLKHASRRAIPMIFKHASKAKGKEQPYLDNFVESVATEIITKKKPHLLCMHLIELDHERHVMGLHEPRIKEIIARLDARIGRIIEATKKAGIYDKTTFVLLGDHGGTNFTQVVYMNTYFEKEGFLKIDKNRNISSWKAYANSCGGSTQIHIHKDCEPQTRQKIKDFLGKLAVMPGTFIKNLYSKSEVQEKFNLAGDFDFVIEPREGYVFHGDVASAPIKNRASVEGCFRADHGNEPTHPDLKTLLLAKGPRIKRGVVLENARIIDEGPTFAKILGLKMENIDGRVIEEILSES